ncbi:permease [Roseibium alexandrii]|uniref:Putative permease n=1 Tax=Roseibium alexandrii (strain DSM 17067 / NCIMB 14079 / DFL-11) TaxID=244592 RepID=A0A5E8GZU3_ROSAD|nr:permease [Roseibium alexandrii]EEE45017.2 putative permease [Roseibium alexandrii DFL-11]
MADQSAASVQRPTRMHFAGGGFLLLAVMSWLWPRFAWNGVVFTIEGLIAVAPLVVPGILLTAWIMASGADKIISRAFEGHMARAVLAAAAIGAITPVCGVTVLPLMVGLLAAGVPLAPVMAFWLSSPVTDPAMLATTAATLGLAFAIGKTVAAFGLGLFGGTVTAFLTAGQSGQSALRDNGLASSLATRSCCELATFSSAIWRDANRREAFYRQVFVTTRLILSCLIPAFFAEFALNQALTPGSLAVYVGADKWWAIPAAVFVGAPAYIDGYAALPLTRGLVDNGMSPGAAMAFLVSGGVVSIWGALAIFPVLKLRPFLLYLALAITGSLLAGYAFGLVY